MNGTAHAGLAVLSLVFVAAVFVVRYAVTPAPVRVRPVEEYVPAGYLIPALAVHGSGWPRAAFAYCIGCHAEVPVVVHAGAHRCDQHGHITIHTAMGD